MSCWDAVGQWCPLLAPQPKPRRSRAIREARRPVVSAESTSKLWEPGVLDFTPAQNGGAPEAFFSGYWPGTRCDWTGDVGVSFVPLVKGSITALGRQLDAPLQERARVTLWEVSSESALACIDVGPGSAVEGNYAFEQLLHPVILETGCEYRITQHCTSGMMDKWFDGSCTEEEASKQTSAAVRFVGGVCRNEGGYPKRYDGNFRRAGMVNFKFAREGVDLVSASREQLASALESVAAGEEAGLESIGSYVAVLSSVLRILLEDFDAPCGLLIVAPEADLAGCITHSMASSSSQAASIFDPRFPGQFAQFSIDREPCAFLSHQTGVLFAVASQLLCKGEPMTAAHTAMSLRRGVVFQRTAQAVLVFPSLEIHRGRAYQLLLGSASPELPPVLSQRVAQCPQVVQNSSLEVVQGEALDESEAPRAKMDEASVNGSWSCSPNGINLKFDWLGSK